MLPSNRNKVNLFVVGAAKAGTTSFHNYLNQHPLIDMSNIKEPNYFSSSNLIENNLYYRNAPLIKSEVEYNRLFQFKKSIEIFGESSVSYLYYKDVPEKIFKYNPDAKIIIFLRNPIERAFSHYLMDFTAGYIHDEFSDLIRNPKINELAYQQVVYLGMYSEQIKRYFNTFPEENVKIIVFEEATKDLFNTVRDIEIFLNLECFNNYNFDTKNMFQGAENGLVKLLYRNQNIKSVMRRLLNKRITKLLKDLFLSKNKPQINDVDKRFLLDLFSKDIHETSILINRDLNKIWFE